MVLGLNHLHLYLLKYLFRLGEVVDQEVKIQEVLTEVEVELITRLGLTALNLEQLRLLLWAQVVLLLQQHLLMEMLEEIALLEQNYTLMVVEVVVKATLQVVVVVE
jgi:hypothetical protein